MISLIIVNAPKKKLKYFLTGYKNKTLIDDVYKRHT